MWSLHHFYSSGLVTRNGNFRRRSEIADIPPIMSCRHLKAQRLGAGWGCSDRHAFGASGRRIGTLSQLGMAFDLGVCFRGYLGGGMCYARDLPLRWRIDVQQVWNDQWRSSVGLMERNGRLVDGLLLPSLSVFTPDPGLCSRAHWFPREALPSFSLVA